MTHTWQSMLCDNTRTHNTRTDMLPRIQCVDNVTIISDRGAIYKDQQKHHEQISLVAELLSTTLLGRERRAYTRFH